MSEPGQVSREWIAQVDHALGQLARRREAHAVLLAEWGGRLEALEARVAALERQLARLDAVVAVVGDRLERHLRRPEHGRERPPG
jgi:hypothetical protein